ncbi:MAG: hypothetical protein K0M49_03005 [Arenimonas sp.]|nr:hypothetical protein [Rhizobium sp.]MBW8444577.1 hypothetical protein [Arenimonas sp.]
MTPRPIAGDATPLPQTDQVEQAVHRPPRSNRVTPFGGLEATPARGTLMGNRGDLHAPDGTIARHHAGKAWICCTLAEKNGRRVIFDTKGHYTPLFFHDEAVSFAAGHRPCAECRRADFLRFKRYFNRATGRPDDQFVPAREIDAFLHSERLDGRIKRLHPSPIANLPDGSFFTTGSAPQTPLLLWQGRAHPWSHEGYGAPLKVRRETTVAVLTPPTLVEVLRSGYRVTPRL